MEKNKKNEFNFHEALSVIPKDNYHLIVEFKDKKVDYDMQHLFEKYPVFQRLKEDESLYHGVVVDTGGYGLVWNGDIDLSATSIWYDGTTIETYPMEENMECEPSEIEFHEALSVIPEDNYHLIVEFKDKKVDYDMNPLLESCDKYHDLKEKEVFNSVKVDFIGGALLWPKEVDLSTDEIWNSGITI